MRKDKAYWEYKARKTREKFLEYKKYLFSSGTYFRFSLTILFTAIFFILFFSCGGLIYFNNVVIVDKFTGVDFQIHSIAVGQGDSTLIKFPNNQTMLIDAGERDMGEHVTNYVREFLKTENLKQLDFLVLTHPDSDHIGGAIDVLENIKVETVYRPKVFTYEEIIEQNYQNVSISNTETYTELVKLINEKGINVIFTDNTITMNLGDCKVEFLSPEKDYYTESNQYSAVIMITYQTKKFLFMGDADAQIEQTLISTYGDYLKADVLKVSHHGSQSSSSELFLQTVKPSYALLYVGVNKDLPSSEVINRLHSIKSKIFQTSLLGDFAFTIINDDIKFAQVSSPTIDIALLISLYLLLVMFTWGINNYKPECGERRVPKKILQE